MMQVTAIPATLNSVLPDSRLRKMTEPTKARPYFVVAGKTSWRKPFSVYLATDKDPTEVCCTDVAANADLIAKSLNDQFA